VYQRSIIWCEWPSSRVGHISPTERRKYLSKPGPRSSGGYGVHPRGTQGLHMYNILPETSSSSRVWKILCAHANPVFHRDIRWRNVTRDAGNRKRGFSLIGIMPMLCRQPVLWCTWSRGRCLGRWEAHHRARGMRIHNWYLCGNDGCCTKNVARTSYNCRQASHDITESLGIFLQIGCFAEDRALRNWDREPVFPGLHRRPIREGNWWDGLGVKREK